MKRLSICIPTYNRSGYLEYLLESILSSKNVDFKDIQVCVSDNASTDSTSSVVKKIAEYNTVEIKYSCNASNLGADRNYLNVIKMADSDYCWFMGSDDAIADYSLNEVLSELSHQSSPDMLLLNRIECDINMSPLRNDCWLSVTHDRLFDFSKKRDLNLYADSARSLGAYFSYLSSIIFKKVKWDNIQYDETFTGSAYSHAFVLLSMVYNGCCLKYISKPLVLCRMDNDSFLTGGRDKRVLLDFKGYYSIINKLWGDTKTAKRLYRVFLFEYSLKNVIGISSCIQNKTNKDELLYYYSKVGHHFFRSLIVRVVNFLPIFSSLYSGYRKRRISER